MAQLAEGTAHQKEVAFHPGIVQRGLASDEFSETHMENMDEMHFIIDMDNFGPWVHEESKISGMQMSFQGRLR